MPLNFLIAPTFDSCLVNLLLSKVTVSKEYQYFNIHNFEFRRDFKIRGPFYWHELTS